MNPLEQRSKAQVEGIISEFTAKERAKIKPPDPIITAVTKAHQAAREVAEDFARSLSIRPFIPTKKEATDILYHQFQARFDKMSNDEVKAVCAWLHACLVTERLRDYLM